MLGLRSYSKKIKGMNVINKVKELGYQLKLAWQRAWRGYDDGFWQDMDRTFIALHLETIKQLKAKGKSYPSQMTEDEWNDELQLMIYYLNAMDIDKWDNSFNQVNTKDKFFALYSKHFYDLWS